MAQNTFTIGKPNLSALEEILSGAYASNSGSLQETYKALVQAYMPLLLQNAGQMGQLQDASFSGIQGLVNSLNSETGRQGRIQSFGNYADEQSAMSGRQQANQLKGMGYSNAMQAGAVKSAYGQGQRQKGAFMASEYDPATQAKRQQSILDLIGGYQQMGNQYLNPIFGGAQNYTNLASVKAQEGDGGLLGTLGSLAGMATGMGWNPFGKGGK